MQPFHIRNANRLLYAVASIAATDVAVLAVLVLSRRSSLFPNAYRRGAVDPLNVLAAFLILSSVAVIAFAYLGLKQLSQDARREALVRVAIFTVGGVFLLPCTVAVSLFLHSLTGDRATPLSFQDGVTSMTSVFLVGDAIATYFGYRVLRSGWRSGLSLRDRF